VNSAERIIIRAEKVNIFFMAIISFKKARSGQKFDEKLLKSRCGTGVGENRLLHLAPWEHPKTIARQGIMSGLFQFEPV
jgi:hypothetical protein